MGKPGAAAEDPTAPIADLQENQVLRKILDAVPSRIWFMDREHRTMFANREAARMIGEEPGDLVGRPTVDIVGEESFRGDLKMRENALAGGVSRWAGWATYADGKRRFTERVFHPHFAQDGAITGYYEFVRDATQEMAAQSEARRWARLLRDAVESLPDAISVEDADGRLAICNRAYADLYGQEPEALLGRQFADRIAFLIGRISALGGEPFDASADDAVERFKRLRDETTRVELTLTDGTELFIQRANTSEGGRAALMTDVTELRRREHEADQARKLLEDAIEAVALGFAIFDADGGLQMCNALFREMIGSSGAGASPGVTWPEMLEAGAGAGWFVDPDGDPAGYAAARERALGSDTRRPELVLADGRRLQAWRRRTRLGGAVLTLTDVTERRRMERELRRSEDLVRHVLEACPVPITMVRAKDGAIIYETEASREMMRSGPLRKGATSVDRWLEPEDREAFIKALRKRGVLDGWERQFRRGDGSLIWLSLASRLITYRGEEVIVTTAFDLTERRAAQEELERQREIAQQAEKLGALGELLAGISHELNNPLSVLVGQAAILRETTRDAEVGRRVEKISEAADRCARIVRSFLAMARQGPAMLDHVDINAVVESAAEIAAGQLRESGATLELRLCEGLPTAWADADQVRQVVVNLLVNAAHALREVTGERRVIVTTTAEVDGTVLRLDVADTGPGVPLPIRSRVFEPLFTTKEVGQGTGIGLTLVHRIVSAHGGRVQLLSPDRGGALLRVELPASPAPAAAAEEDPEEEAVGAMRILVVDDDGGVRLTTSEVLQLDGHVVDCAGSAEEAIGMVAGGRYDIVISDVRMPGTDGLELYAMLRRDHPQAADRLVFATGDMLSPDLARALRGTGRPCLEKPFLPSDVRAVLESLVEP